MRNVDTVYEAETERLHDEAFSTAPQYITCDQCGDEFLDDDWYSSKFYKDKVFCSKYCAKKFDDENNFEEG